MTLLPTAQIQAMALLSSGTEVTYIYHNSHCMPVPAFLSVEVGMRYIPELNAFVDPSTSVITSRVSLTAGLDGAIVVAFPGNVDWSILDHGTLNLEKTNYGLAVRPAAAGTYIVRLHISFNKQDLTAELIVDVQEEGLE